MSHKYQASQSRKRQGRYLDWLVQSKAGADLLANQVFPNAKEVTESLACFEATTHLPPGFEWNNKEVSVFVVGDGHKPRTAMTFAFRTAWNCHSIDPVLAPKLYDVKRLTLHRTLIEDFVYPEIKGSVLIVMPHSHANVADCLEVLPKGDRRALITMDCCVKNLIKDYSPDVEYRDENVWSPENLVRVWRSI